MRIGIALLCVFLGGSALAGESIPLDRMTCGGPFDAFFFVDLTKRADLNAFAVEKGKSPETFYKFELVGDVYVSPPTFKRIHDREYVFLSMDNTGLSVSRFVELDGQFVLMAQHPVEVLPEVKKLQYRSSSPDHPPDWTCTYP